MGAESDLDFVLVHAPGWFLYCFVALAGFLGWWAWRRYGTAPPGVAGWIARGCRAAAVALMVLLLTGPAWKRTSHTEVPGRLAVVVDTSASMARTDASGGRERLAVVEDLRAALEPLRERGTVEISWHRIGGAVSALDPAALDDLEAVGSASPLGNELAQVVFGRNPDCVILLSDGKVTAGSSLSAIADRLAVRRVPQAGVWTLGAGSEQIDPELAIDEIEFAAEVPLGELIPVRVLASGRNLPPGEMRFTLRLGDEVLDDQELQVAEGGTVEARAFEADELYAVLHEEGDHTLHVEVALGDLRATASATVRAHRRSLQVLILAHRPRYEIRYLREALRRDDTVTVHSYLSDGRWRRWGNEEFGPAGELPLTSAALAEYDAIIVGDLPADLLRTEHLESLVWAVRENGSGLIWLPGESGALASFRNTRLGVLLPVRVPDPTTISHGYLVNDEVIPYRTEAARLANLLATDDQAWHELPRLRGACPVIDVLELSTVLVRDRASDRPLVVVRDFGAGKALFVGVDDTWRWRRNVGDRYLHRFWSQLLRHVSAGRGQGDDRWRVVPSPHRSVPGTPVQIGVVPNGAVGEHAALPTEVTVRLSGPDGAEQLHHLHRPIGELAFLTTVPAPAPGPWTIEVVDGLRGEQVTAGELVVLPPADEVRDPRIDGAALQELASATGGRAFFDTPPQGSGGDAAGDDDAPSAAHRLIAALPELAHHQEHTRVEPVWDTWLAFLAVLILLACDWSLRRWHRLP